ncbi:hypothetical protein [Sinimarinibacterium flocculans]
MTIRDSAVARQRQCLRAGHEPSCATAEVVLAFGAQPQDEEN